MTRTFTTTTGGTWISTAYLDGSTTVTTNRPVVAEVVGVEIEQVVSWVGTPSANTVTVYIEASTSSKTAWKDWSLSVSASSISNGEAGLLTSTASSNSVILTMGSIPMASSQGTSTLPSSIFESVISLSPVASIVPHNSLISGSSLSNSILSASTATASTLVSQSLGSPITSSFLQSVSTKPSSSRPTATVATSATAVVLPITTTYMVTNYVVTNGYTSTQISTVTPVISVTIADATLSSMRQTNSSTSLASSSIRSNDLNSDTANSQATQSYSDSSRRFTKPSSLDTTSTVSQSTASLIGANSTQATGGLVSSQSDTSASLHSTGKNIDNGSQPSSSISESTEGILVDNGQSYSVSLVTITGPMMTTTQTKLQPLNSHNFSSVITKTAAVGATATFSTPAVTIQTPYTVPFAGFDNPQTHTASCTFPLQGTSTTLSYDPWCATSDGNIACLCPFCAATNAGDCMSNLPKSGTCPALWLCNVKMAPSTKTAEWILPPGIDVPRLWSRHDYYTTCVTASDLSSCSSITYTATLSKSTTTNIDGDILEYGWRSWVCPDALCDPSNFVLDSVHCLWNLNCISGFFHGFPPAPQLIIPPIFPPEADSEIQPHSIGHDDSRTKATTSKENSSITLSISPVSSNLASSSRICNGQISFTFTTRLCSVLSSLSSLITDCTNVVSSTVACTGSGSITISTIPCSLGVHTAVIVGCPASYSTSIQCTTHTVSTYTGCSDTTSTIIDSCPTEKPNWNDPAIQSSLSAWIAQFPFTLPTFSSSTVTSSSSPTSTSAAYSVISIKSIASVLVSSTASPGSTSSYLISTSTVFSTSKSSSISSTQPSTKTLTTSTITSYSGTTFPFSSDTAGAASKSAYESSASASLESSVIAAQASENSCIEKSTTRVFATLPGCCVGPNDCGPRCLETRTLTAVVTHPGTCTGPIPI